MSLDHIDLQKDALELESESLGQKLELIIEKLPPNQVTLIEIMDIVGKDSLALLAIFLSLVFLVPVSIPGVSTVFGAAILLIGITMLLNRKLWLPKKVAHRQLSSDQLRGGFTHALKWFHRLEKVSRPHRLPQLTTGWAMRLNGLSFVLASILLMMPFGLVPFSNTLPALALIFLAVGLMQRDGVSILIGNLFNIGTVVYFGVLIAAGGISINALLKFIK